MAQAESTRPLSRLAAALAASIFSLPAFAQLPSTDWIDFDAIDAGDVEIQTAKGRDSMVTVDVAIRINADREVIWNILKACEIAPQYAPNVEACRLIDSINNGRSELFVQTVKPAFFIPRFEHVFRLDYDPPIRMGVRRVSGPIAQMDGDWWLLPRDDSILLMHSLKIRSGLPVPKLFVRATLKHDLPIVLEAVRDRAESASAQQAQGL